MDEKEYIDKITKIRSKINDLVDALWNCKENQVAFTKTGLENKVYEDIRFGYEKE